MLILSLEEFEGVGVVLLEIPLALSTGLCYDGS